MTNTIGAKGMCKAIFQQFVYAYEKFRYTKSFHPIFFGWFYFSLRLIEMKEYQVIEIWRKNVIKI